MKTRFLLLTLTIVAASFLPLAALAQSSASATASISATVISPIVITKNWDMSFGSIVPSTGGTVVLNPSSSTTTTGNVALVSNSGTSAAQSADFTVTGEGSYSYTITLPTSAVTLTDGSTDTMTVDNFTSNPSGTGTLPAGGSQDLEVGATLHVASGQPTGGYVINSFFDVYLEYN